MGSVRRFVSGAFVLGLAGAQVHCTFPSDWEFLSGGTAGSGASGGNGTGGAGAAGTGGSGATTTSTSATGGFSNTGGAGGMGGAAPCGPDTADCDMNPANGCEASLKSTQHCGACDAPCQLANAVNPCATGECMLGACINPYENCDGVQVNGCESNLLTDKLNCGMCGKACPMDMPNCSNGVCSMGCSTDQYEPNDVVQAPLPPPMPATMVAFDENDNDFKLSTGKTGAISPNLTANDDVDVFYLHVTDDVPLPMGKTIKGAGFDITLSGVPAGAEYSIRSFWICDDGTDGASVFNVAANYCVPDAPNTDFSGGWWYCHQNAPAPGLMYTYGHRCETSGDATGILQIEVKVLTPPAQQNCAPYTLSVHVFPIAI